MNAINGLVSGEKIEHTGVQLSVNEIVSLCDELFEAHEKAGYPIF